MGCLVEIGRAAAYTGDALQLCCKVQLRVAEPRWKQQVKNALQRPCLSQQMPRLLDKKDTACRDAYCWTTPAAATDQVALAAPGHVAFLSAGSFSINITCKTAYKQQLTL